MGPGQQHGLRKNIGRAEKAAAGNGSWKATLIRSASVLFCCRCGCRQRSHVTLLASVRTALPLVLHMALECREWEGGGAPAEGSQGYTSCQELPRRHSWHDSGDEFLEWLEHRKVEREARQSERE